MNEKKEERQKERKTGRKRRRKIKEKKFINNYFRRKNNKNHNHFLNFYSFIFTLFEILKRRQTSRDTSSVSSLFPKYLQQLKLGLARARSPQLYPGLPYVRQELKFLKERKKKRKRTGTQTHRARDGEREKGRRKKG